MSNSLLTINMITREAVRLFQNTNAFIQNIDRQYDDSFAVNGAKIGSNLRIRLPNDYVVTTGPGASIQDTAEQSILLTVATQKHVDVSFTTADLTLSLDDYSERILAPQINNLAGAIAADIMSGAETGICNLVSNLDGSGNIIAPTATTYLTADAVLDLNSAQNGDRKVVNSPITNARVVSSLTGLLNPVQEISKQYRNGKMFTALNFEWMKDQTVLVHTTGSFTAGTVNGASQTGTTLVVNAITGTLAAGDIITIAGVNAVNRVTKATTGQARQFVVLAAVANGGTSISIYPAITPAVGGSAVQYQTVTASPANGAAITLGTPANSVYRKNIAFAPQAVTMATADLAMPTDGARSAREVFDGISMRMVQQYNISTDQDVQRLDCLYGYLYVKPEWAVTVCDSL
jgi:hypothetical protein